MKSEILEELWKIKDQIAREYEYNIDKLANDLHVKEAKEKGQVVDFTTQAKPTTAVS